MTADEQVIDASPKVTTTETEIKSSSPSTKNLSFAELLKLNMPKESPKLNAGVPIISIPASELQSPKSTSGDKKKNNNNIGSGKLPGKRQHSYVNSPGRHGKPHGGSTTERSTRMHDATLTPPRDNTSDHGLFVMSQQRGSQESHGEEQNDVNIVPTPPSELASQEDHECEGQKSFSPAVNVWQMRMSGSSGSVKNGSASAPASCVNSPESRTKEMSNVEEITEAVGTRFSVSENASVQSGTNYEEQGNYYGSRSSRSYYSPSPRGRGRGFGGGRGRRGYYSGRQSGSPSMYYPMVAVDTETLRFYLLGQIEYYFSVENLCKDIYFRSKMDANGWVDLSVIAGFNRVKALTADMNLIVETVKQSLILDVEGNNVRKKEDWETWILPAPAAQPTAEA